MEYAVYSIDMQYYPTQIVQIKDKNYRYIKGTLLTRINVDSKTMWWVQYSSTDGSIEVDLFEIDNLNAWNYRPKCVCGSDAVGHPGHAHYCPLDEKRK